MKKIVDWIKNNVKTTLVVAALGIAVVFTFDKGCSVDVTTTTAPAEQGTGGNNG